MAEAGVCPLGQADVAALARVSGIALSAYRQEHVARSVSRVVARHGLRSGAELARLCQRSPAVRAALRRSILVPGIGPVRDPGQFELLGGGCCPGCSGPGAGCGSGRPAARPARSCTGSGCCCGSAGRCPVPGCWARTCWPSGSRRPGRGRPGRRRCAANRAAAVRWERRDLVRDPAPAGLFDLVLCRNVAIYLSAAAQQALHAKLAAALRRGGVLLLGRSERLLRPEQFGLAAAAPHAVPEGGRMRGSLTARAAARRAPCWPC